MPFETFFFFFFGRLKVNITGQIPVKVKMVIYMY